MVHRKRTSRRLSSSRVSRLFPPKPGKLQGHGEGGNCSEKCREDCQISVILLGKRDCLRLSSPVLLAKSVLFYPELPRRTTLLYPRLARRLLLGGSFFVFSV
jgi:hypothetical protein